MPDSRIWPPTDDREFDFLRAGLASRLFPERDFPDAPKDLDWEHLYNLLTQQRLGPHFYVLGKTKRQSWPATFRESLRLDRYRQVFHGDLFLERIKAVLDAIVAAKIPVIVLKGWALIQSIYAGDHGQRIYDDIDILVGPADADQAEAILCNLGWIPNEERRPGYTRKYFNARAYYLFEQVDNHQAIFSIGFHWGLLHHPAYNPEQVDIKGIFERANCLEIAGVPVLEMSIEDQIVYACAHIVLQHHSGETLLWYYEIAFVIYHENSTLEWQKVERRAVDWKVVIPLQSVICKIDGFWPGLVPATTKALIEKIKPALSEEFIHAWYQVTHHDPSLEHLLTWLTIAGITRRFSFIFEEILPNPGYMKKNYGPVPGNFLPLLHFHRFQLICKRLVKLNPLSERNH